MEMYKSNTKVGFIAGFIMIFGVIGLSVPVEASVKQMKFYKEAFPGTKPKCLFCHVDKIPKKDDGKHDLNLYGLKVKKTEDVPTAETYKMVGTVEDFEEQDQEVTEDADEAQAVEAVEVIEEKDEK